MAKIIFFDCFSGQSGTLALAALLDAGLALERLRAEVEKVGLDGWALEARRDLRGGIAGTEVVLTVDASAPGYEPDALRSRILGSALSAHVQQRSLDVLARVQGSTVASGDVPLATIVEVVGVVAGLDLLEIEQVFAVRGTGADGPDAPDDLMTPVASALLAVLATLRRPAMRLSRTGYGLGRRSIRQFDATRVWIGHALPASENPMSAPTPLEVHSADAVDDQSSTRVEPTRTADAADAGLPPRVVSPPLADAPAPLNEPKADALLLIEDGSTLVDQQMYRHFASALTQRLHLPVQAAFVGAPDGGVRTTLAAMLDAGARRIAIAPLYRTPALQSRAEVAGILRWARGRWSGTQFVILEPIWTQDHLLGRLTKQTDSYMTPPVADDHSTAFVLVAPGSTDEQENAEWYRLARLLWERRPGWSVEVAFATIAQPDIPTVVNRCVRLGVTELIVVPTMLFDGPALEQIRGTVHTLAAELPAIEIDVTRPLGTFSTVAPLVRHRYGQAVGRFALGGDDLGAGGHTHGGHAHSHAWEDRATPATPLLPPRYLGGQTVSAAPMGAASLRYGPDGLVAWDQIWTDFCDLALAGGPPHRGDLLEPVDPREVGENPVGYMSVMSELERGLRMVTGLPILPRQVVGWIGLECHDEDMALWMLRAIVVENVSVRREGRVLFFPAGPNFRLEHEIKNIITVVAKTFHYWTEHWNGGR